MSTPSPGTELNVAVRPMQEVDLVEARRIFRVAFGTLIGVPDPEAFWADREYIFTRWRADPRAALVAEVNGVVAGSNRGAILTRIDSGELLLLRYSRFAGKWN